ncbi:MAG TPA: tetrathionate reductase family octaheme c-type cytochrome [Bacteroidota bacterium]|nr:tetrathionate reductase family octaheme c-type cytochrome [Bacteroidota bacterium]
MKRIVAALVFAGALFGLMSIALHKNSSDITPEERLKELYARKIKPSVDHSIFPQLKKKFKRPQEVTAACISCHNGRAAEVMHSTHWNWERTEYIAGKGIRPLGKKNVLNNFCIGITGNEQSCNKCHIGYGYADAKFNFNDSLNVDCLACHDNTATYTKAVGGAGMPDTSVNLSEVARHVGKPERTDCGTCHFFGGGGNNVKHGDLDKALFDPTREVDVHMASDGEDMQCVDCHTAEKHQMLGKMYSVSSMNRNRVECERCHTSMPHSDDLLNKHTLKVACQTCHIPTYAKVNPTKLHWDWSTAGRLRNGEPFEETDSAGTDVYMSIKGSFIWGRQLKPEYVWFNGTATHYLVGDTFDPSKPLKLNELFGGYDDPDAKIYPVKIHRANQIYDTQYKYLIQPKTVSNRPGDGGYWKEFNWQRAAEEGMKLVNLPYSGKYGFAETEMYWPVNHMVSPKEEAVKCTECHTRENGRLAKLGGFYIPGRDYDPTVEWMGTGIVALTLAGVILHGGARIATRRKRKESK